MIELIYTSAKVGLRPGSFGFTSVAWTKGIPTNLIDPLESMSSYKHVFLPGDPQCSKNPVCFSYQRVQYGSVVFPCFSRICDAGLDYTSRSNKIAHHIVPENSAELDSFCADWGPAGLFLPDANFEKKWNDAPRLLPQRKAVFPYPPKSVRASFWEKWAGDAGWAGVIAQRVLSIVTNSKTDYSDSLYLVYDLDLPSDELIRMIAEITVLLPADKRSLCTFNTYFVQQQLGVSCVLRAVLADSSILHTMQRLKPHNIFRICGKAPIPPEWENDPYVIAARTGAFASSDAGTTEPVSSHPEQYHSEGETGTVEQVAPSALHRESETLFMIPQEQIEMRARQRVFSTGTARPAASSPKIDGKAVRKIVFFSIIFLVVLAILTVLFLMFSMKKEQPAETVLPPHEPSFTSAEKKVEPVAAPEPDTTPNDNRNNNAKQPAISEKESTVKPPSDQKKTVKKTPSAAVKKSAREKQKKVTLSREEEKEIYKAFLKAIITGNKEIVPVVKHVRNVSVDPREVRREGLFETDKNGDVIFKPSSDDKRERLDTLMQTREVTFTTDTEVISVRVGLSVILEDLQPKNACVKILKQTEKFEISYEKAPLLQEFSDIKPYLTALPNEDMLNSVSGLIQDWNRTLDDRGKYDGNRKKNEGKITEYFQGKGKTWNEQNAKNFEDNLEQFEEKIKKLKRPENDDKKMEKYRDSKKKLFDKLFLLIVNDLPSYSVIVTGKDLTGKLDKIKKLWDKFGTVCEEDKDKAKKRFENWKSREKHETLAKEIQKSQNENYKNREKAIEEIEKCNKKIGKMKTDILDETKKLDVPDIFQTYLKQEEKIPMTGKESDQICKKLNEKIAPRFKYAIKEGK